MRFKRECRTKRFCVIALMALLLSASSPQAWAATTLPISQGQGQSVEAETKIFAVPGDELQAKEFDTVTVYSSDVSAVSLEENKITFAAPGNYSVYPNNREAETVEAQLCITGDDVSLSLADMNLTLPNGNMGAVIDFKGSNGILSMVEEGGVLDICGVNSPALSVSQGKSATVLQNDLYDGVNFNFGITGTGSAIEGTVIAEDAVIKIGGRGAPAMKGQLTAVGSYIAMSAVNGGCAVDFDSIGISSADSIITIAADTQGKAVGGSVPSGIDMISAELSDPATVGILEKDGISSIAGIFTTYDETPFVSVAGIWDTGIFRIGVNIDPNLFWQRYKDGEESYSTSIELNVGDGLVKKELSSTPVIKVSIATENEGEEPTDKLVLTFDEAVPGFSVSDIFIYDYEETGVQKGELIQTDWETVTYELSLQNTEKAGRIGVGFGYYDCSFSPSLTEMKIYPAVPLTAIKFSEVENEIYEGEETELAVTAEPKQAVLPTLLWSSSDSAVADVDSGKVKAVSPGTAEITVSAADGEFLDVFTVTVLANEPETTPKSDMTQETEATPEPKPTDEAASETEPEATEKPESAEKTDKTEATPVTDGDKMPTGDTENIASLLSVTVLSLCVVLVLKRLA